LVLATTGPLDLAVLDQIELVSGRRVRTVEAPELAIRKAIERFFTVDQSFRDGLSEADSESGEGGSDRVISLNERLGADRNAPAVRLVDTIVRGAARQGASDIHIEPINGDTVVRCRIDGVLHDVMRVSRGLQEEVVSRIKLMAGLDITEHRVPQDGRIGVRIEGYDFDLRVSTLLTVRG